jgi:hypothetical protein
MGIRAHPREEASRIIYGPPLDSPTTWLGNDPPRIHPVWTTVIPAIISGLLGAGVASVVAPWSNWGVEKRRSDREYRRGLIQSWRNGIAELTSEKEALGTGWYESLRPHLTSDEILKVEGEYVPPGPRTFVVPADPGAPAVGRKPEIDLLARAVTRVEREWKLRPERARREWKL